MHRNGILFCSWVLILAAGLFVFFCAGGCTSKEEPGEDSPTRESEIEKTPNPWFHDGCLELTPDSERWIVALEKRSNPILKTELIAYRTSYKTHKSTGMAHADICKRIQMSDTLLKTFK